MAILSLSIIDLSEAHKQLLICGNSDLKFGVGESNLTLFGSKDDYKVAIEKGLGSISVDGKDVSDLDGSGNGQNRINIEGGVGTVNIAFREE